MRLRPSLTALEERTLLSTFTVDNTADDGSPGSLRWAVGQANSKPGADSIVFDGKAFSSPQTITLNGAPLKLSDTTGATSITGPAAGVTIDGNHASRVFQVDSNVTASFSGLSITGGNAAIGAGLANFGTTTLTACTVSGNIASDKGGGIYNHGAITLTNSTVSGNASFVLTAGGTPVVNTSTSDSGFTVSGSDLLQTNLGRASVTGNINDQEGLNSAVDIAVLTDGRFGPPGIIGNPGPNPDFVLIHDGVQITYNLDTSTHPLGYDLTNINTYAGWQDNGRSQQDYTVLYSTVAAPNTFQVLQTVTASGSDGSPSGSAAFLTSSTGALASNVAAIRFSFPSAQNGYVGYRELDVLGAPSTAVGTTQGGGLYNASGNASLTNCTFSGNVAGTAGGGLYIAGGSATMTNTIVAGNNSDIAGVVSGGHNLIGAGGSGGLINGANGNIVGVANPGLGPLANYTGPTPTIALLPGSPAIGAGTSTGITTDQRGLPLHSPIDIGAFQVQTSPLVVNTTYDGASSPSGQLDLRDAINLANLLGNNQTILFDPTVFATPQKITLTNGPLKLTGVTGNERIIGPSAGLTIDGNGSSRVFQVDPNVTASLSGLTITGGQAGGDDHNHGGGLANYGGTVTLTDCTVTGNSANGRGGGLYGSGGSTTLIHSTVAGNSANGGGLFINNRGGTTLTNCTVSGNSSTSSLGGGLYITNRSNATLTNCTVSGNSCGDYAGGGGLFVDYGSNAVLTNCTVAGNNGGGLFIENDHRGTATLINTIVAAQSSGPNLNGTASGSHNLIGTNGTGGLHNGVDGNIVAVANPGLAPLGDYGGTTQTYALLPGSPAIDAGTSGAGVPTTDIRGVGRVGGVDIGAFESEGFTLAVAAGNSQSADIGTAFANPLAVNVVANNPLEPVDGGVVYFGGKPFNGPTAMPSARSATIANGQAGGISVAPNNALGSYNFVASAGGSFTTSFALTNTGTPLAALVVNTTTNDSLFPPAGVLSLREAVAFASYDSLGISDITFDPTVFATPQTITLTGTQLEVLNTTETVTITAPAAGLTISGGGLSRVFYFGRGALASLTGLTITGGSVGDIGGGLLNDDGTVTLTRCTISGNTAGDKGGGLYAGASAAALGSTTLVDCTVSGNSAQNHGGGLYDSGGTTTLTNSKVSGNSGEGLYGNFGTTILKGSTVSGNSGSAGLILRGGTGMLTDSTISGNSGHGVYNAGTITLTNCTVSGNSRTGLQNGGIYIGNYGGKVTLTNCTISGNQSGFVGGLYNRFGAVTAVNTIIAGNSGNDVGTPFNSGPVLTPASTNNVIGSVFFGDIGGQYIGGDPLLAPLGDYGGPTQTMPLLPGSPAIGGGMTGSGIPTTDQRGIARVGAVDIGACQSLGFTLTAVPGSTPQSADIGTAFANPLAVTIVAKNPLDPVDGGVITFGGNPVSGPSAVAFKFTDTIVNGRAGIIVLPNNYTGSYNLIATAGGSSSTSFALTNTGTPITALVVNTTVDSLTPGVGLLSLREAVLFANANLSAGLPISFDPTVFATPQTITLALGELTLTNTSSPETITGPAAGVTVSGGGLSRVLLVNSGVNATISGLTITGGNAGRDPAGLINSGTLTLTNCNIRDNTGGGLVSSGTATITNCTISGNTGGGVVLNGTAVLANCTISGNSTTGSGAGLVSNRANATLTNCTISGNTSTGRGGGGVAKFYGALTMNDCNISGNKGNTGGGVYILDFQFGLDDVDITTLNRCTISGNTVGGKGGGVYAVRAAREFLTDCTISGNTAGVSGGGVFDASRMTLTGCTITGNTAPIGGGFYNSRIATLTNCIITENSAGTGTGGGLFSRTAFTTLGNSIVAGNTAGLGPDVYRVVQSQGKNLIGAIDGSSGWLTSDLTGSISHPVVYWTGLGGDTDWDNAKNWLGNAVPGQNPEVIPKVVIPNGITVQHTANTTETIDSLNLGSGATLNIGAGNFTFQRVSGAGTITAIVTLITSGTGAVVVNGGSLTGAGLIRADVTNSALFAPTGSFVVSGNYTQTAAGTLADVLAGTKGGTDYGQLFVNGIATLNGTLDVTLASGFTPAAGDAFVPLSFGSIFGDFRTKNLPGGRGFLYNANTLIILPPPGSKTTSTNAGQPSSAFPQATLTVPSNASTLNLSNLPVGATVTIDGNADSTNVTGPTQNFTAVIPQSARYANLVVNGGAASNTNIVNGFLGSLTLNPAGTDNTFVALNTQPVSLATTSGGKVTSTSFVVNLNTPNQVQTPERLPANTDVASLLDPTLLVSGSYATLVLGGRFDKAVAGNGVTLYAAPSVATVGTVVPGSQILLVGTGNKVYGAAGAVVQAYSGGNTVIQSSDPGITTVVNAYAATTGPQSQAYLNGLPVAQQAFLQSNAAGFAQFLAGDPAALSAFLRRNPTAVAQYLSLNSTAQQAFLAGNSAAVAQYLATDSAAQSAFLARNSAAVTAYIAGVPDAQQAFLRRNRAGVAAYIAGNTTALSAYLDADSGGIGAYIASNSTALAAYLRSDPSAPGGGAELQAYLRRNPTRLRAFLTGDPTTFQTYLAGSRARSVIPDREPRRAVGLSAGQRDRGLPVHRQERRRPAGVPPAGRGGRFRVPGPHAGGQTGLPRRRPGGGEHLPGVGVVAGHDRRFSPVRPGRTIGVPPRRQGGAPGLPDRRRHRPRGLRRFGTGRPRRLPVVQPLRPPILSGGQPLGTPVLRHAERGRDRRVSRGRPGRPAGLPHGRRGRRQRLHRLEPHRRGRLPEGEPGGLSGLPPGRDHRAAGLPPGELDRAPAVHRGQPLGPPAVPRGRPGRAPAVPRREPDGVVGVPRQFLHGPPAVPDQQPDDSANLSDLGRRRAPDVREQQPDDASAIPLGQRVGARAVRRREPDRSADLSERQPLGPAAVPERRPSRAAAVPERQPRGSPAIPLQLAFGAPGVSPAKQCRGGPVPFQQRLGAVRIPPAECVGRFGLHRRQRGCGLGLPGGRPGRHQRVHRLEPGGGQCVPRRQPRRAGGLRHRRRRRPGGPPVLPPVEPRTPERLPRE
ncbi:MAG: choice-of-anchor Q domain-containing protein [Isosphaeraceae bacterium]